MPGCRRLLGCSWYGWRPRSLRGLCSCSVTACPTLVASPALQFVADGVFYAELNELLTRELAEHGYSGVEVRVTPLRTEIIIRATRTQNVLGECRFQRQLAEAHTGHHSCIGRLLSGTARQQP
jgi:hypothetical protein